jgi:hypothetical protein
MTDKKMSPDDREMMERELSSHVRNFIDQLEEASPNMDDGEEHTIEFIAGRVGEHDGYSLYSVRVKRTQDQFIG